MNRARHFTVCSMLLAILLIGVFAAQAAALTVHPRKGSVGIAIPRAGDFTLVEVPFEIRNGPVRKGAPQLRVANRKRFKKSSLIVLGGVRKVGKQWLAGALIVRPQSAKAVTSATSTVDLQIVGRSTSITADDVIAHANVLTEPRATKNLAATCSQAFQSRVRRLVGSSRVAPVKAFMRAYEASQALATACREDAGSQSDRFRRAIGFDPTVSGAIDCRGTHDSVSGTPATDRAVAFSCTGTSFNRFTLRGPAEAQLTAVTAPAEPSGITCALGQDGSVTIADCVSSTAIGTGTLVSGTSLLFADAINTEADIQIEVYSNNAALLDFLAVPR